MYEFLKWIINCRVLLHILLISPPPSPCLQEAGITYSKLIIFSLFAEVPLALCS